MIAGCTATKCECSLPRHLYCQVVTLRAELQCPLSEWHAEKVAPRAVCDVDLFFRWPSDTGFSEWLGWPATKRPSAGHAGRDCNATDAAHLLHQHGAPHSYSKSRIRVVPLQAAKTRLAQS